MATLPELSLDWLEFAVLSGCMLQLTISLIGAVGNTINLQIFYRMGLKDGVTLSFFTLACCDLLYLLTVIMSSVSYGVHVYEVWGGYLSWFPVEPYGVFILLGNIASTPYTISVLVITYLAVARCLSISRPFQFRNIFTKTRTVLFVSVTSALTLLSSIPVLALTGMRPVLDPRTNSTRIALWISPSRQQATNVIWVLRDCLVPAFTVSAVVICVITMSKSLKKAVQFRQTFLTTIAKSKQFTPLDFHTSSIKHNRASFDRVDNLMQDNLPQTAINTKEILIIQQMVLICAVYLICNTPKILINGADLFLPEFTIGKKLSNIYLVLNIVREIFQTINSSVPVFIYYSYNTKYRNLFSLHYLHGNK